jgi:hypothetical protein
MKSAFFPEGPWNSLFPHPAYAWQAKIARARRTAENVSMKTIPTLEKFPHLAGREDILDDYAVRQSIAVRVSA